MESFLVKEPFVRIILGPMKAEKSTCAVRLARKYGHFCNVLLVNSTVDTRSADEFIVTHSGEHTKCTKVGKLSELEELETFKEAQLVVIDEGQFFGDLKEHVFKFCDVKSYVVASLDADAKQEKFGQVWDLIPIAKYIEKLHGLCEICKDGTPSICSIKLGGFDKQISVDDFQASDSSPKYLTVCLKHRDYAGGEK